MKPIFKAATSEQIAKRPKSTSNYLNAGFIYAPYTPVYGTPRIIMDELRVRASIRKLQDE
jgi:hypothetical protein